MPRPLLGSELFINRGDTPEQARRWVRIMAEARLRLIRLFALWDLIQPEPERWDFACFDAVFDEAQRLGLGVVPTAFGACPPGWMRLTIASQEVADLDDPRVRAGGEAYLRKLVTRYREHPALHSWIVWNEASMIVRPTDAATDRYRQFLARQYGSVAGLNDRYYAQHEAFEQVQAPAMERDDHVPIPAHLPRIDWWRFCVEEVTAAVSRFAGIIRALDPAHPVHLNPHRLGQCMFHEGQSVWQIAKAVDFVGCSAHPVWHSTRFGPQRTLASIGLFCAMCRGASRAADRRFWVSELQGGPAAFSGFEPGCPSPQQLRYWVWEGVSRGAEAVVFWTLNGRREGGEVGEWMLLDQRGRPSARLDAVTQTARELEAHAELLAQTTPPEARTAVLCSESSWMHGYAFGHGQDPADPRNRHRNADAACGAFFLLDDLHIEADFIDEDRLSDRAALSRYRVLVLPDCWSLSDQTIDRLLRFVGRGGTVIADGLVGYLDPWTRLPEARREALELLFGSALVDYLPTSGEVELPTDPPLPGLLNRIELAPAGARGEAVWPSGHAAVTRQPHARGGEAIRIGTHLFQAYLQLPGARARAWLAQMLPAEAWPAVHAAADTPAAVRVRMLAHLAGGVLVALNRGPDAVAVTVHLPEEASLDPAGDAEPVQASGGTTSLRLPGDAARLYRLKLPGPVVPPVRVTAAGRTPAARAVATANRRG